MVFGVTPMEVLVTTGVSSVCQWCVCVSSGGVATMCGVRSGSLGGLEAFGSECGRVEGESMHPIYRLVA